LGKNVGDAVAHRAGAYNRSVLKFVYHRIISLRNFKHFFLEFFPARKIFSPTEAMTHAGQFFF
jgi:hypothetical protein